MFGGFSHGERWNRSFLNQLNDPIWIRFGLGSQNPAHRFLDKEFAAIFVAKAIVLDDWYPVRLCSRADTEWHCESAR